MRPVPSSEARLSSRTPRFSKCASNASGRAETGMPGAARLPSSPPSVVATREVTAVPVATLGSGTNIAVARSVKGTQVAIIP